MLNIGPSYEKPPESTPPHDRHENHKVVESFYSENRLFEHRFFFEILKDSLGRQIPVSAVVAQQRNVTLTE